VQIRSIDWAFWVELLVSANKFFHRFPVPDFRDRLDRPQNLGWRSIRWGADSPTVGMIPDVPAEHFGGLQRRHDITVSERQRSHSRTEGRDAHGTEPIGHEMRSSFEPHTLPVEHEIDSFALPNVEQRRPYNTV
jgi:hypothetical protein